MTVDGRSAWRRLETQLTLVYVTASLVGMAAALAVLRLVLQFRREEFVMFLPVMVPALTVVFFVQGLTNRRWLRQFRALVVDGAETAAESYRELLSFPWRASSLSFLLWLGSLTVLVAARRVWLDGVPLFRDAMIISVILGNALVVWTLQYFLFRRVVFARLESLTVSTEVMRRTKRISIITKYSVLFSFLLVGAVLYAGALVYGMARRSVLETFYAESRDLFLTAESMIFDYDFGASVDVQAKLAALSEVVPGTFRITPEASPGAMDLYAVFSEERSWYGLPYQEIEKQAIPDRWILGRPLTTAGGRTTSTWLEYEIDSQALRGQVTDALVRTLAVGGLLAVGMVFFTVLFLADLTRPIRRTRLGLHPRGETLSPPPLVVADDELMLFSFAVRRMFTRLRELFQDLLKAYWEVKDRRAKLQEIMVRFQQRSERDGQQISAVTRRLRSLAEQVQGLGLDLATMSEAADSVGRTVRTMADAATGLHNETAGIRSRVRDARDWVGATADDIAGAGRAVHSLERWIGETGHDFEAIRRRFREMGQLLERHEAEAVGLHAQLTSGAEHARTNHLLLAGESERFGEGADLIQTSQLHLDVVMRQFEKVESIREQVDMLSFQAAVVASQSTAYERDFRVVADEIRDLSERAAAGIQEIFSKVWALNQQGRQTLERILGSRVGVTEAMELSRRAEGEAGKAALASSDFTRTIEGIATATRAEGDRVVHLADSLQGAFSRGSDLRASIDAIGDAYADVEGGMSRLDDLSRLLDLQIHDQQEGLRMAGGATARIQFALRELSSSGDGMLAQSRTMRSLLERLVEESARTGQRVTQTMADLTRIEEEILRNEAEVKRVSAELQNS